MANICLKKNNAVRGFSLIEMLLTIAILSLIIYPIYEFLNQGTLAWELGENKTETVQNNRIGLDKLCDEIKHARQFYTINSTQIRFWWRDLNEDEIADADEILTYRWSGASGDDLTRKFDSQASATPLANYVNAFELMYFNATGVQTADLAAVRFITAKLTIKKTGKNNDYFSTMRKGIHLRNM
ncbi:MAG: prepilin-type N-terminal cleavage/methylation domain-containing protein [Candidatus Omnitrophica bacterium]|nr:prepilin-type N-terminal cleavage/methylation domain-containing protein [Candidatus Omnitrophota bacterium]